MGSLEGRSEGGVMVRHPRETIERQLEAPVKGQMEGTFGRCWCKEDMDISETKRDLRRLACRYKRDLSIEASGKRYNSKT